MRAPENFSRIVGGLRYSTKTATLIAGDDRWDGSSFERHGRNTWLYRTPGGAYFTVTCTQWQGKSDTLKPLTEDEAIQLYENDLPEHMVDYEEAFPGVEIKDA
jgi:hypothetical protein